MELNYLTKWLGIQGMNVVKVQWQTKEPRTAVILTLERDSRWEYRCGGCGRKAAKIYAYRERTIQHLTLWQHMSFLCFQEYRVACARCGLKVERLPFVERSAHVSQMLASQVYELCKVMTVKAVALLEGLHRETVRTLDKRRLQQAQQQRPLDGITQLGVDEIAIGKGHKYLHMISALDGPRGPELLYVGEGRKEKDLEKFWKWFGKERIQKIQVAVMDMWKGFINSFKAHCPSIVLIYDKFHIIRHLLEALNKVRKQQLKQADKKLKGLLIAKKFILLSRASHVRGKARESLNQLLGSSKKLLKAHLLKESFSHLWSYKSKTWAVKFWNSWKDSLKWSRLNPYQRFAKMIDKHLEGILACCDHRVPLGFIEATNLKARNLIRRAYGYRDKEYMKLKIIQTCSHLGIFQPWSFSFNNTS